LYTKTQRTMRITWPKKLPKKIIRSGGGKPSLTTKGVREGEERNNIAMIAHSGYRWKAPSFFLEKLGGEDAGKRRANLANANRKK